VRPGVVTNMPRKLSFCITCIHEQKGVGLSEAEARIHRDNNPDHNLVDADIQDEVPEVASE